MAGGYGILRAAGLVTRQADDRYVINRELSPCYDHMEDWQRNFSSALYATFGRDSFTRDDCIDPGVF